MRRALLLGSLALAGVGASACGKKSNAIAELKTADGPVEKQPGDTSWGVAKIGTKFSLGDAARTADGGAGLEVVGGAQIKMQPHTILRFGGKGTDARISVELGAIDLSGSGNFGLSIGDVRLSNGTVRITAKGAENTVELLLGDAQVSSTTGVSIDLVIGQEFDLTDFAFETIADAGVADAGVDAPADAPVASADEAMVVVEGKKAEILAPGETKWVPLPAGAGAIAKGSKLRVGAKTTATLTAAGTTLAMAGGSRVFLGEDLVLSIEAGPTRASAAVGAQAKVKLPGGAVELNGGDGGAETKLDTNTRETQVAVTRGGARLTGANGGDLAMSRGETAKLAKNGTIRVVETIPTYFDFKVAVGETLTIHDPKGTTAVQFAFGGKCPQGGFIEMDKDTRYRTAKVSGGKDGANMMVGGGSWAYRLRCSSGGGDTAAVASGRIAVKRDAGTRQLLREVAFDIDADGRNYRVSYQSQIPNIAVRIKGEGAVTLHVAQGGSAESYKGAGKITIPGSSLKEGTYTYWIERGGVKEKVSTLTIDFDNTAPQVYIQAPINGRAWGDEIEVRGAMLPGWSAAVDTITIPIDRQRRFAAKVSKPTGRALAIRLSHPQRGVHYYLRRGK